MRFKSKEALREYLANHPDGREVTKSVMNEVLPEWLCEEAGQDWLAKMSEETGRPRVLVVCYGDGYGEVFVSDRASVKVIEVASSRKTAGTKAEAASKLYASGEISNVWRRVWSSGRLVCNFFLRRLKVEDLIHREVDLAVLREITNRSTKEGK